MLGLQMSSNQNRGKQVRYITVSISVSCAKLLLSIQPCTQRNIFGSHWLLNVQTLVARAKNELFWKQVSYFTDSACQYWSTVHKFLHHSHASPSSPSLLRLAPPPKKIKDCCRFDTFLVSLSTPQLLSKLYLVCFEYSWAESLVLLYICSCIYIVILYCTCFVT